MCQVSEDKMKIIVKNHIVIALHNDNQDVSLLYPGSVIRNVFIGFEYTHPIPDIDIEENVYNRYKIKVNDPDPMTNIDNVSLANCIIIAAASISDEVNQYIQYKQVTGEVRYTQVKQSSFTDIIMYCKDWLEDNPSATSEQKALYETKITLINSARDWIRTVLNYYYSIITSIRIATIETIGNVTWDFSTFDESDPDVWLETVRI